MWGTCVNLQREKQGTHSSYYWPSIWEFSLTSSSQVWFRQPERSLLQWTIPSQDRWWGGVVHMAWLVVLHQICGHDGTSCWPWASPTNHCPAARTTRLQQGSRWLHRSSSWPIGWWQCGSNICLLTGAEAHLLVFKYFTCFRVYTVKVISTRPSCMTC